jgi:hypothetical protein
MTPSESWEERRTKNNRTKLKGKLEQWTKYGSPKQRDATTAVTTPVWLTDAQAMKLLQAPGAGEPRVPVLRLPHRKQCTRN